MHQNKKSVLLQFRREIGDAVADEVLRMKGLVRVGVGFGEGKEEGEDGAVVDGVDGAAEGEASLVAVDDA